MYEKKLFFFTNPLAFSKGIEYILSRFTARVVKLADTYA